MKNRLSDAEYQKLLTCIQAIHECRRMEDFPRHVAKALRKIIDSHLVGYNEVDLPRNRFVVVMEPVRPDIERSLYEAFAGLMQEHPVITYFDRTGDGQALMISDFLSAREYHRRALYRDCYRHVEVEDQLSFAVQIGPGFMIGIAFNRKRRSFKEKDRLFLNLVRPHVIQAYLRLAEIAGRRERQADLHQALRESGLGVITVDRAGEVIHATPGAFDCLNRYLPAPSSVARRLPRGLREWLRKAEGVNRPDPMIIGREQARLIVRYAASEDRRLLLLSEENSAATQGRLDRYELTEREREVLRWLAEGKANSEIATILGLTSGTVKLHVEHILQKLGVRNRVMAALVFRGVAFS